MIKKFLLFSILAALSLPLNAVVIRHDIEKENYLATKRPQALVNMPYDGHGLLIAPSWIVTVGHLIFEDYRGRSITIANQDYEIDYVVVHPDYSKPAKGLFTGHSGPSQAYLKANHDIALIKLKKPVINAKALDLYRAKDEKDKVVTFYGKGNTGTGLTGQIQKTRGVLRKAQNRIIAAEDQWLTYQFEKGEQALLLEGIQGDGDSGGPVIIEENGLRYLAGLASWDVYDGDISDFRGGLYGMQASVVRISYYIDWIEEVMHLQTQNIR